MKKIIISVVVIGLLAMFPIMTQRVSAAETTGDINITAANLGVSEPSTGLIGWLKGIGFSIQYGLSIDPIKKANLQLNQAGQRLLEAQKNALNNNNGAQFQYEQALAKYETAMQNVQTLIEKAKNSTNPKVEQFIDRYTSNVVMHQIIFDHLKTIVAADKITLLNRIDQNTAKSALETIKAIVGSDQFGEMFAKALTNVPGGDAKYMKAMEFLTLMSQGTDGQVKEMIQGAQDRSLGRLISAWNNLDPQVKTERFKAFLNNDNPTEPYFTLQLLDTLQNGNLLPQEIKSLIPAIKNDKVIKLNQFVEAIQNKEDKQWYLEKIQNIQDPNTRGLFKNIEEKLTEPENSDPTKKQTVIDKLKDDAQEDVTGDNSINRVPKAKDIRDANNTNSTQ